MASYCEECGSELVEDCKFCDVCGTPVPIQETEKKINENIELFVSATWAERWLKFTQASDCCGIILTDTSNCKDPDLFNLTLSRYINFSRTRCVEYCVLNMATEQVCSYGSKVTIKEIIHLLKKISDVARIKYLLIVGNETVFESAEWKNEAHDPDTTVTSDLPYVTFDLENPWQGQKYDFRNCHSVGRIPSSPTDDFRSAIDYMNIAMQYVGKISKVHPFGLSALEWKAESNACFANIGGQVFCSPEIDLECLGQEGIAGLNSGVSPNLLYFNLHGSDKTKFWYGQSGKKYPETMSPEIIKDLLPGYFIGVEACYGARYCGISEEESILSTAINAGCLAFLGSSKIAYGTPEEPGSCADIMVGEFVKGIYAHESAGDAYINALSQLCDCEMDDSEIKTMAEFSLYGDPAVSTGMLHSRKNKALLTKYHIPIPDTTRAVLFSLSNLEKEIKFKLDSYAQKKYIKFQGIEPRIFKLPNKGVYQSIYTKDINNCSHVLKIYFDEHGNILKEYTSK